MLKFKYKEAKEIVEKLMRELSTFTRNLDIDDGKFYFEIIDTKIIKDSSFQNHIIIKFLGEEIWNSYFDSRNENEPLEDYLRRRANRWLQTLSTMSF